MRLRGMLLVGRRLGGGRLLVEWCGLFHAFFFLVLFLLNVCTMDLVSSPGLLVLLCFERRLYVGLPQDLDDSVYSFILDVLSYP